LLAVAVWRGDRSFGASDLWEKLAGPADLGPVDFPAISRSATGNDALFCPTGLCGAAYWWLDRRMQRLSDTLRDTYKLGLMIIYGLQMVLLLMFAI
jgi:hypothetical protein